MVYRVVVERQARRDAEEALAFLRQESPEAAGRWYAGLLDRFGSLATMPQRCARAPEPELAALGFRQLIFGAYRILFTVDEGTGAVHVHHVRHGARKRPSADA